MGLKRIVEIFGDSILRGYQVNPKNKRYYINNNIDLEMMEQKHSLKIKNFSGFGHTVTKGFAMIKRRLESGEPVCDTVLMNYGGNDSDHKWNEIAERPDDEHLPNTPPDVFVDTYRKIIAMLKEKAIRPILATLPPIEPQKFLDWFGKGLNKENILKWLGSVGFIYRYHESYSRAVERLAAETGTALVDLRGGFLVKKELDALLCEDGTHPSTEGQRVITQIFLDSIGAAT